MADKAKALAQHKASGDTFVVALEATWGDDMECAGSRVVAVEGPVYYGDLGIDGPVEPSPALFDRIDAYPVRSTEAVEWFIAEEEAGNIAYPVGIR